MKYKVYELINTMGTVEYVGVTKRDLNIRFLEHIRNSPIHNNGHGKFKGRQDLTIIEVESFETIKAALALEGTLKLEHNLEWVEGNNLNNMLNKRTKKDLTIGGQSSCAKEYVCIHCGRQGKGPSHFNHQNKCALKN